MEGAKWFMYNYHATLEHIIVMRIIRLRLHFSNPHHIARFKVLQCQELNEWQNAIRYYDI